MQPRVHPEPNTKSAKIKSYFTTQVTCMQAKDKKRTQVAHQTMTSNVQNAGKLGKLTKGRPAATSAAAPMQGVLKTKCTLLPKVRACRPRIKKDTRCTPNNYLQYAKCW